MRDIIWHQVEEKAGGANTKIPDVYEVLVCSSVDTKGEKNFSIMILKYNFLTLKKEISSENC